MAVNTSDELLAPIYTFLRCQTPAEWIAEAAKPSRLPLLLREHAQLEIMAGQAAMTLMRQTLGRCADDESTQQTHDDFLGTAVTCEFSHIDSMDLLNKMSKLAREELRHFEQVMALMKKRKITYKVVSGSRYAKELHKHSRKHYRDRLVDSLIVGAFIEARSCERFAKLAPHLDEELSKFYLSLLKSEARHYQDYIALAANYCEPDVLQQRIDFFAQQEYQLVMGDDTEFRFHSGVYTPSTGEL
jgi:tRNA-(ms[2]io[6]A)-hydroxylase